MSYISMSHRSAGYVVPASEWNQLIDNDVALLDLASHGLLEVEIDDDHVYSETPLFEEGIVSILIEGGENMIALFISEPLLFPFVNSSNVEFDTSALTGTTGTDGKFTVAFDGSKLYYENRLGATKAIDRILH
jgi:hypothetical protein